MADFLTTLQKFESGGRNIPNTTQGTSSGQAQGYNQITTGTWKEFGGLAYAPTPLQATQEQQNAIAAKIPLKRWAPETLVYLRNNGFTLNPNATLAENIAANHGTLGTAPPPHSRIPKGVLAAPDAAAPATPTAAPTADQPWWSKYTDAPVDKEGKPIEGAKSPVEKAIDAFTGRSNLQAKMEAPAGDGGFAQGPGARNVSPLLQNIAQTYGQTLNSYMQPLTWNSAPPGLAGMRGGFQGGAAGVPGVSINSIQPLSENLGLGIPSNFGMG